MPEPPAAPRAPRLDVGSLRTVFVAPSGGPVSVQLAATNLIAVGSRAQLWRRTADGVDRVGRSFVLRTGEPARDLPAAPADLAGLEFHVRLRACAMSPLFSDGEVRIEFVQDGEPCASSRPVLWERRVPPCEDDRALAWQSIVLFSEV